MFPRFGAHGMLESIADFVASRGDPTSRIADLNRIQAVWRGGVAIDLEGLQARARDHFANREDAPIDKLAEFRYTPAARPSERRNPASTSVGADRRLCGRSALALTSGWTFPNHRGNFVWLAAVPGTRATSRQTYGLPIGRAIALCFRPADRGDDGQSLPFGCPPDQRGSCR
jgi:hypothetical protein